MITHTPYFLKQTQKKPVQNRVRTSIPTFLVKTYEMLENQEHKDIVCWSEDGKSFLIKKHNEFRDQVLPQYFKHNNYSSFVRQLNMYDFHKVRNESTDSEYKNPLFQRGQQKMLSEIKRKSGDNNNDEFSTQQNDNNDDSAQILQNASGNSLNIDVDNSKSDNTQILSEVSNLKSKQNSLEKAMTMLISQHETLIRENKILWDEIRRQNEQDDLRGEKIMMVLAFFLNRNNQFNNSQTSRSLVPQQSNNRRPIQPSFEDIQQFLQNQSYQKRDNRQSEILQGIYQEFNKLNNGKFSFDTNESRNPYYSLPLIKNKKARNESFTSQISQDVRELLKTYEKSGSNDKEMIEQYLQKLIGSNNIPESRSDYLPIEPLPSSSSGSIKHEKQSLNVFENPQTKRICQETLNPLNKGYSAENTGINQSKIEDRNINNQDSHFQSSQLVQYGKQNSNNISNQVRSNSLPKLQSNPSYEHLPFDGQNNYSSNQTNYASLSPNIHSNNGNNPIFTLSRTNSSNLVNQFHSDKLGIGYSASPIRMTHNELPHSSITIGDHPNLFPYYGNMNGSFTPEHNYHEDEEYTGRSRRSSFDKNHDQSNNFSNIN
ncbi:HSF-type DNA-binding domain protein (macronuclear) [Tetrahymena thermophila SB210]|uniref:HSF-type DNA-binding domain protein n=1 Tax=Tetrahymena thermophila (strain SB210) TaxID=312017 RepID=Q22EC9_TETTS|nr:HSF-type DNA-binding domain protein [Tetrahymena thermophila SB210]EAR83599.2 HSF-type DNA-binding domain protein [Tetrahymena thermophila SB210]|eukprot:XP_001031262.2 HSF-type DNA-binding domain protein [Tetrahymena thermophila SB210]